MKGGLAARWIAVVTVKFSVTLMLFMLARATANLLRVCRMLVRFYFTMSLSANRIMSGYCAWAMYAFVFAIKAKLSVFFFWLLGILCIV